MPIKKSANGGLGKNDIISQKSGCYLSPSLSGCFLPGCSLFGRFLLGFLLHRFLLSCSLSGRLLLGFLLSRHKFTSSQDSSFDGIDLQDILGKIYYQTRLQLNCLQDALELRFIGIR